MERYTMFLGWKYQYCPNDYSTTQDSTDTLQSLSNYNAFFTELGKKKILYRDTKAPEWPKQSWESKTDTGGIRLPDFRPYYKVIVIKIVSYWYKNRDWDQWKSIESPEINPCTYGQWIYNKGGKTIQWRKDSVSINGPKKTGQSHVKWGN